MNRGELRAAVRTELLEPTAARWTDAQLNRYMNDILLDLARVSHTVIIAAPVSVNGGVGSFLLPATILIPQQLMWVEGTSRYPIKWSSADIPFNDTDQGIPRNARIEGNTVRIWPVPAAAGQVLVRGLRRPAPLNLDTDIPELIDVSDALIAGVVWNAYVSDFDPQRDLWAMKYMTAKGQYLEGELRRNPQQGRMRDVYDEADEPSFIRRLGV